MNAVAKAARSADHCQEDWIGTPTPVRDTKVRLPLVAGVSGGISVSVERVYRTNVQAVLLAARDLEEALDAGDEDDIVSGANNLLSSALARESGGVVAGFRSDEASAPPSTAAPGSVEEELSLALTELQVGEVLLTSAAVTVPQRSAASAEVKSALSEAIDDLDDADDRLAQVGAPAVSGFFSDRKPSPEDFFVQLPKTIDGIVQRTAHLGLATVRGLTKIPTAQLQPVFGTTLSAAETASGAAVGALAKAGMRAIARALQALATLVPENLRQQVRDWTKDWWEQHAEGLAESLVRRVLSVAELQAIIGQAVEAAKQRADLSQALRQGVGRLSDLDERHARVMKVIERIVVALSRLIGPLVMAFPVAAPWIYGSGGGGMVTALGVSVWIGRDYLDTGIPFERVTGVRTIVMDAVAAPNESR
jgi:hypothetical protein